MSNKSRPWIDKEIETRESREAFRKKWTSGEKTFDHVLHALSVCLVSRPNRFPEPQLSMRLYDVMHSAAQASSINTQQPIGVWQDTSRALDRILHAATDELLQIHEDISFGLTIRQMFMFLCALDLLQFAVTKDGGGGELLTTLSPPLSSPQATTTTTTEEKSAAATCKLDIVQRTVFLLRGCNLGYDVSSDIVFLAASAGYDLNKPLPVPVSISPVGRVHILSMCFSHRCDERHLSLMVLAICMQFGIPLGTDLSVHGMIGDGDQTLLRVLLELLDVDASRLIAQKDPDASKILPMTMAMTMFSGIIVAIGNHCHRHSATPPPSMLKYTTSLNTSEAVIQSWSRQITSLKEQIQTLTVDYQNGTLEYELAGDLWFYGDDDDDVDDVDVAEFYRRETENLHQKIITLKQLLSEQRAFDARLEIEKAFRCTTSPLHKLPHELCVYIGEMI